MNEAQLFTVFSCIIVFGWVGFAAGRAWADPIDKNWNFMVFVGFMLSSADAPTNYDGKTPPVEFMNKVLPLTIKGTLDS